MTPRITSLTPEQEALLPLVRDEWLAIGLSTGAPDKPRAESGVREAYRAAGLEPPAVMIWLDSPWAGVLGQAIAPEIVAAALARAKRDGQVYDQVYDQVYGQVYDQVDGQVDGQVRDQVRDQVYDQVRGQVRDQVYGQVDDQVDGQDALLRKRLAEWWHGRLWGQWSAGYYSWLDAHQRIGVTGLEPIRGQAEIARAGVGYWWCFRDFAVLTPRSLTLHLDAQGRLHHESEPAMLWPDGWAIHAWHGTRVPADLIETGWDTARILREPNTEIRRCAIERMGWPEFVAAAGLRQVGEPEPDPANPGFDLRLFDVPEQIFDAPVRVLLCTNASPERDGTRRRFGLTVAADIGDPTTAAASLLRLTREQYLTLEAAS